MGQTFAEKIFARKANRPEACPGETVTVTPDVLMTLDADAEIVYRFKQLGVKRVWDADRIVGSMDHYSPASTVRSANVLKTLRDFAREQGIRRLYDVGEGVTHEVLLANGHVLPGHFVVGTDSHTPSYGAVAAFSCGIGTSDALPIWATGRHWFKVPESVKVTLAGTMPRGVYAKDLILDVIRHFTTKTCRYMCMEYVGDAVRQLTIAERVVLANLSTELGAKAAYVQFDEVTQAYAARAGQAYEPVVPDDDARYAKEYRLNVTGLQPLVACPHRVDNVQPVAAVAGTQIHQAFVGTCASGRLEDLELAARITSGKRVAEGVRLLVAPASRAIFRTAIDQGYVQTLLAAGATFLPPGCGPCMGLHQGLLADGERCVSTGNRNFMGRMGSHQAEIYLASVATVVASAVAGVLTDPREML
jgi:3-isopropylmalate/(R)-2-methylmalate dehydratase large subunit